MLRGSALATVSSPFGRGDGLVVNGLSSFSRGLEFVLGGYTLPVGADGLKVGVSASYVRYKLDASLLTDTQLSGDATARTLYSLYPVVHSRNLNLFALASVDVLDVDRPSGARRHAATGTPRRQGRRGDRDAAARIARGYLCGDGDIAADSNRCEGWLQYAAALGNGVACYELAVW